VPGQPGCELPSVPAPWELKRPPIPNWNPWLQERATWDSEQEQGLIMEQGGGYSVRPPTIRDPVAGAIPQIGDRDLFSYPARPHDPRQFPGPLSPPGPRPGDPDWDFDPAFEGIPPPWEREFPPVPLWNPWKDQPMTMPPDLGSHLAATLSLATPAEAAEPEDPDEKKKMETCVAEVEAINAKLDQYCTDETHIWLPYEIVWCAGLYLSDHIANCLSSGLINRCKLGHVIACQSHDTHAHCEMCYHMFKDPPTPNDYGGACPKPWGTKLPVVCCENIVKGTKTYDWSPGLSLESKVLSSFLHELVHLGGPTCYHEPDPETGLDYPYKFEGWPEFLGCVRGSLPF